VNKHYGGSKLTMSRKVISLSLPETLLDRVDEHTLATGYASLSEYIRELIRNDLRQNGNESEERLNWRSANTRERFTKPTERW
jgi:Predicted transcriptional regulators containing the CopG/Arc/MetJ DNA-binding domain and a metal-binding domain